LSNILFRSVPEDYESYKDTGKLIFEFVVIIKKDGYNEKPTEMSCGWCELAVKDLDKGGSFSLNI